MPAFCSATPRLVRRLRIVGSKFASVRISGTRFFASVQDKEGSGKVVEGAAAVDTTCQTRLIRCFGLRMPGGQQRVSIGGAKVGIAGVSFYRRNRFINHFINHFVSAVLIMITKELVEFSFAYNRFMENDLANEL